MAGGGQRRGAVAKPHASREARTNQEEAQGIAGGWVRLGLRELVIAWTLLRMAFIRQPEFRTLLCLLELKHERSFAGRGKRGESFRWKEPEFYAGEVARMVGGGGGERGARAALRKLARLGLVTWTEERGPELASTVAALSMVERF